MLTLSHSTLSLLSEGSETCSLHIPHGFTSEGPIELTCSDALSTLRIDVQEGAKLSIIEHICSDEDGDSLKHALEITIGRGARLDFTLIEDCLSGTSIEITQESRIDEHAEGHFHIITLGGENVQHDFRSHVEGEKSISSIDWIFYGKDEEKQKLSARNVFDAKDGGGEIMVQGIAEGRAHTEFNGMIEITKKGGGTNTYLTETTLMLDPTAKVDAVPALEIKTNDVKASHSATVTKVSEADLFYCASRGIPVRDARRMYVEGFLGALTAKIPSEKVRNLVQKEIREKYET